MCVCKGCGENIDEDGFCTEGCRFGEFAGVWTCDCGKECEDVEFCPDCPREDSEEGSTTNEEDDEEEEVCNDCGCDLTDKHYNEVYGNMVCDDCNKDEDYESADCAKCCENFLLDKMEKVDDKLFCRDCIEPCKCTDAMDIRGRCQIDKAGFTKCPAFADTACFYICNDSDLDMKIKASEDLDINCTPIIIQWLSDHNVPADLHESILNLYNEWRVDEYDSPNVSPYKKCSECGERKSCGSYCDTTWFCENCAEEEEEEDCRTKPCSCGCGYLGGSCDEGLAIDNEPYGGYDQVKLVFSYIRFEDMTMEKLCEYVRDMDGSDVSEGWTRDEIIAMIKKMNE